VPDRLTPSARTCSLLGIVAGIFYLANPFAARLLLPNDPLPAVASELGGRGQPLAAFFNGTDIASGLANLTACAALLLLARTEHPPRLWTTSAVALMIQAAGTILAALFPLPETGEALVHWTLSRMDGVGLLASLLLFAGYRYRNDKRFLAAAVLVALTFALYQFTSDQALDGLLQRLCILETAGWIGLFPILSVRNLLRRPAC
jgi:hypothetical membrane protein